MLVSVEERDFTPGGRGGDLSGHAHIVASRDFPFEENSNHQVRTGTYVDWPGVLLRTAHVAVPENLAAIPALAEDSLVIGLRGNVYARVKLSKVYADGLGAGSLLIHPRGQPGLYDLRGVCDVLMLHIDPVFMGTVALEALDFDPARVEISEQFGVRDGLVEEMGVALLSIKAPYHNADILYAESLIHTLALHTLRQYIVIPPRPPTLHGKLPRPPSASSSTTSSTIPAISLHLPN
jgi:hypothetical protein